jgi:hypothetical protein
MLRRTSRAALALAAAAVVLLPLAPRDAIANDRAPSPSWAEISNDDSDLDSQVHHCEKVV